MAKQTIVVGVSLKDHPLAMLEIKVNPATIYAYGATMDEIEWEALPINDDVANRIESFDIEFTKGKQNFPGPKQYKATKNSSGKVKATTPKLPKRPSSQVQRYDIHYQIVIRFWDNQSTPELRTATIDPDMVIEY